MTDAATVAPADLWANVRRLRPESATRVGGAGMVAGQGSAGWYDFGPLELFAATQGVTSIQKLADRLHIAGTSVYRYRLEGLPDVLADRFACALGAHPSQVWPTWFDDALASIPVNRFGDGLDRA